MECGKVSRDFVTMVWWRVTDGHVTHHSHSGCMTRVTWGPWESKRIVTVVKCISSREMSENSIEFSLSNSEQRDSWLNSGHRTLDADIDVMSSFSHWLMEEEWGSQSGSSHLQGFFRLVYTNLSLSGLAVIHKLACSHHSKRQTFLFMSRV